MDNSEKTLNKKLKQKLPEGFDKRFWEKTGAKQKKGLHWKLAPIAAVLVFALIFLNTHEDQDLVAYDKQIIEMLEDETVAENFELMAEVELSDEEWKELLNEA